MEITTTKKVTVNGEEVLVKQTDAKKAMVLLNVIKNLEERALGGAIQRQLSVSTKEPSSADEKSEIDMDAVDKRLKELEEKLGPQAQVIDV